MDYAVGLGTISLGMKLHANTLRQGLAWFILCRFGHYDAGRWIFTPALSHGCCYNASRLIVKPHAKRCVAEGLRETLDGTVV